MVRRAHTASPVGGGLGTAGPGRPIHRCSRGWWPSWDGKRVAFKMRHNNSDETTTCVLDSLERSKVDVIDGTEYAGAAGNCDDVNVFLTTSPVAVAVNVADYDHDHE